jgi:cyclohexyl-isocyanide hydratase
MIPPDKHLQIGSLAFDELDQMDLTGPFEVFAGLPNSTHPIFAKTAGPVRDVHGLKLVPMQLSPTRRSSTCCTYLAVSVRKR